eukprot:6212339-Pleurochrysis_carterae.AAC.1
MSEVHSARWVKIARQERYDSFQYDSQNNSKQQHESSCEEQGDGGSGFVDGPFFSSPFTKQLF